MTIENSTGHYDLVVLNESFPLAFTQMKISKLQKLCDLIEEIARWHGVTEQIQSAVSEARALIQQAEGQRLVADGQKEDGVVSYSQGDMKSCQSHREARAAAFKEMHSLQAQASAAIQPALTAVWRSLALQFSLATENLLLGYSKGEIALPNSAPYMEELTRFSKRLQALTDHWF